MKQSVGSQKIIFAHRGDGLGARICNLLWTWRFARKIDARTVIIWTAFPESLQQFFGADFRVSHIIDLVACAETGLDREIWFIEGGRPISVELDYLNKRPKWKKKSRGWPREDIFGERRIIGYSSYYPLAHPGETIEQITKEARSLFNKLPRHPAISQALDKVKRRIDLSRTVALHYRRGDIIDQLRQAGSETLEKGKVDQRLVNFTDFYFRKCAPLVAYTRAIESELVKGNKILIFSDQPHASKLFSERYGTENVLDLRAITAGMPHIQEAFLEIIVMAQCPKILSTNSGFSQTAILLGGGQLNYVKEFASADDFFEEYRQVVGLTNANKNSKAAKGIVDVVANSHIFQLVNQEQGWAIDRASIEARFNENLEVAPALSAT